MDDTSLGLFSHRSAAAEQDGHKKVYQPTGPFSTCFAAYAVKRFTGWRAVNCWSGRERVQGKTAKRFFRKVLDKRKEKSY
ncbi:MAG: hypothetical protein IJI82_08525, partial [Clostridia bacterium]|nr:hypothetical protein [Clostridia bacterium]